MGIKVYGIVVSPGVQRVLAILYEKELTYELVPVDLAAGAHKQEPYTSLNPFGQIPSLEDGDLKLFESRAIVKYINDAYKGTQPLSFEDPKKMAPVDAWMEAESQHFDPAASKLVFQLGVAPLMGIPTDDAVVTEFEAKLSAVLDKYEVRLSKSKYLGSDVFTLADLFHLPAVNYLLGTKAKALFDARPHVCAWAADIVARPAWAKVVALTKK